MFEIIAEEFIDEEVVAPEVMEEAHVVAVETIQHYDTKIMKKEYKAVSRGFTSEKNNAIDIQFLTTLCVLIKE